MLEVRTGCRLHFGLMELCPNQPRCFGGLGLMLTSPHLRVRFQERANGTETRLCMAESFGERTRQVLRLRQKLQPDTRFPEVIEVVEDLPLHHGLGVGTQLACTMAAGLEIFERQPVRDGNEASWWACADLFDFQDAQQWLVRHSGRGLRSAIGLRGFWTGGLVLDEGYESAADSPRTVHVASSPIVPQWRVVTLCPQVQNLISGEKEAKLLESIGRRANPHREAMYVLAREALELGLQAEAFERFTELLERYMELAGEIFRGRQGGLYNGPEISSAVAHARACGLKAVGQSSWGPTVFGFAESQAKAEQAKSELAQSAELAKCRISICTPAPHGATFRFQPTPSPKAV